jgi:glycerophosphoryl diester phosphodiesterase
MPKTIKVHNFMETLSLPSLIAHRGAKGFAPENTLASFREAARRGARWVEFDVMLTKDFIPVVIHDDTLERTTNGHGCVCDKTFTEMKPLDAGSWFDETFKTERISTLSEVLVCLKELGLGANVEIKPSFGMDVHTAHVVCTVLKTQWPTSLPLPLISSFSQQALEVVKEFPWKQRYMGTLFERMDILDCIPIAKKLEAHSIHVDFSSLLNEKSILAAKKEGFSVLVYTVNRPEDQKRLFEMGVDSIFTDYP